MNRIAQTSVQDPSASADRIVYILVTQGGGVDGRDHTDKGGHVVAAAYERDRLERHGSAPWCDIVPTVVTVATAQREALAKLSPVDKLILNINSL